MIQYTYSHIHKYTNTHANTHRFTHTHTHTHKTSTMHTCTCAHKHTYTSSHPHVRHIIHIHTSLNLWSIHTHTCMQEFTDIHTWMHITHLHINWRVDVTVKLYMNDGVFSKTQTRLLSLKTCMLKTVRLSFLCVWWTVSPHVQSHLIVNKPALTLISY